MVDSVYYRNTFLCVLSIDINKRQKPQKVICLKIDLFALYARLFPLGTIISGTPQNVHTSEITKFFIDSYSHLCCVFSFV